MISIVVPVYNSEKNLKACVDSLLKQTYTDIEIILVEDGSKDRSPEICDEYAKKDLRVRAVHKENEGVSMARNLGISMARGEYVQFVDSDDYIAPDMCKTMLETIKKDLSDFVLCGFHHLYLGRDIIKLPKLQKTVYETESFAAPFLELYQQGFLNMPWNKLYKKELIQQEFPKGLSLGEDLLFNLAYMKQVKKVSLVSEPFYFYIQEKNQNTLSSKKREDKLEIAKKICEAAKNFYYNLGNASKEGEAAIHSRFVIEFLDEIEGMAFDRRMKEKEKRNLMNRYMNEPYMRKVNRGLKLPLPDYKMINFFFRRRMTWMVYLLIYLRKAVVVLAGKAGAHML